MKTVKKEVGVILDSISKEEVSGNRRIRSIVRRIKKLLMLLK
ncbi:MAG: hypothetical protein AB7K68_06300 [Bacteriovoracia bacterium]